MDEILNSFNRLPRPRTTPSGLPNHWVFAVRHLSLQPPGDVVLVIHPSDLTLRMGIGQILSASNASEKARALFPLLLNAFVMGDQRPGSSQPVDQPLYAPWTWATEDPELAKALENCLSQHGFVNELCRVGIFSRVEKDILDLVWFPTYRKLTALHDQGGQSPRPQLPVASADITRCHGCGMSSKSFSEPLEKCSACGKAWYHSQDCQRKHWKEHKPECLANRPANTTALDSSTSGGDSMMDALVYFNTTARSSPEALALIRTLYISFPSSLGVLDHFGQRHAAEMQTLFGPGWRTRIGEHHEAVRLDFLIDAPPGSIRYRSQYLFRGVSPDSRLKRSPRPATDAEQQTLGKIREMQDAIRRREAELGGPLLEGDREPIIRSSYGSDWASHQSTYVTAFMTMDIGARS